jgi:hypothetical protein
MCVILTHWREDVNSENLTVPVASAQPPLGGQALGRAPLLEVNVENEKKSQPNRKLDRAISSRKPDRLRNAGLPGYRADGTPTAATRRAEAASQLALFMAIRPS